MRRIRLHMFVLALLPVLVLLTAGCGGGKY
jgi:hypothetical protein